MKTIVTKIDDNFHKEIRIYALHKGITVKDLIIDLVKKELQKNNKKDTH